MDMNHTHSTNGVQENPEAAGRMSRVRERTRATLDRAREGVSAGAATAAERGRWAVAGAGLQARQAARIMRESEPDHEVKANVMERTERVLVRTGSALSRSAPTIGRAVEIAADRLGRGLQVIAHPTAVALGAVAATAAGWRRKAAETRYTRPVPARESDRDDYMRIAAPAPGLTYERSGGTVH